MHFDLILHIGGDKCGSSSLQYALSVRPAFTGNDGHAYRYGTVSSNSQAALLPPQGGQPRSIIGYSVSDPLAPGGKSAGLEEEIRKLILPKTTTILSCEGWFRQAREFGESGILAKLDREVVVVAFVRPQVEWLNSAWWQWGAWTGEQPENWMRDLYSGLDWHALVEAWHEVTGVQEVKVKLATRNVVSEFFNLLNAPEPEVKSSNVALPQVALDFLLRHREFRKSPHAPEVEFVLRRWCNFSGRKAAWVVSAELARETVNHFAESNRALLSLLSPADAAEMQADPRWWNGALWDARAAADLKIEFDEVERDTFTRDLLQALLNADESWRMLLPR